MEWLNWLQGTLGWQAYLAAAFFLMTSAALNLLSRERKDDIALWLMGGHSEESWSKTFLSLFDAHFGENHLSGKCLFRSCIASVLAVSGIWGLMAMTGTLETRFANAMSMTEAIAIGVAVNLVADYLSLLETRFLLSRMPRLRSAPAQCLVLAADAVLTAAIILITIEIVKHTGLVPEKNASWAAIGLAFSVYSAPFYSTFLTSVWTWVYILSTWVLRLFTRLNLGVHLDVVNRPTLFLSLTLSGFVLLGSWGGSFALERGDDGLSPLERSVCSVAKGDVCERLLALTDNPTAKLTLAMNACEGGVNTRCMSEALALYETDGATAARFWRFACENGNAPGCTNLGIRYERGDGVDLDLPRALALYEQACSMNEATGCYYTGWSLRDGIGEVRDSQRALDFFRKACEMGEDRACGAAEALER
ncbi:tetratricopeptide repeat protein [Aestuariicoccus sp. MJ-SS9]|uniref:tetratricopeptide repeat protein n=1 Tax=Aestuariicoccus sp. MJ-SS9 TaxID=3079855 RepID=UPI00290D9F45|nr:tetratricopeptide repeat protein [Aestuariicoccus sp. MJ-SS9]MDU8913618.1 tetratricopeptide repeat protein [Aestuariicoccus sp. MJ-SS9]